MNFLLDVNVLVAWGWSDHSEHVRVAKWLGGILQGGNGTLHTSAIPQLGFVRVSVQRSAGQLTPAAAGKALEGLLTALGRRHVFLPDDVPAFAWPGWCQSASRTTDAHLVALATAHGAVLATLDAAIPGSHLLP